MQIADDGVSKSARNAEFEIIEFFIQESGRNGEKGQTSYFGVNVAKVLEVIENVIEHPPASPPHPSFMGTIPLRGQVLPVLDLSVWLGMERDKREHEVILVTQFNERLAGFLVSGVTTIHNLDWERVQPPSQYISSAQEACVNGVIEMEDHFIMILDFESVLNDLDPDYAPANSEGLTVTANERYHAVVAEDSTMMRALISRKLTEANFQTTVLNTGQDAWEELETLAEQAQLENRPVTDFVHIVVSDVEMPKLDGYSLTKRIKEHPTLAKLPVILFSSNVTDELRRKGEEVQASDQISKPEFDTLARRAIDLIEKRS